jgi:hypothetical protein
MILLRRGPTGGVDDPEYRPKATLPAPYALTVPELVVDELLTMAAIWLLLYTSIVPFLRLA